MVGANLSASVTGVGSSLAAATLVGSRLYPYPYPVAGRTWLDSAGADRTTRAQPEPAGRFRESGMRYQIRTAVNHLQRGDRSREQALPGRQELVAQLEHHP